ncbi:MAG: replicative DNA helicase [Ignavibacteria bacterium]|jgi:replicative DNA helicase|nr:replicative DNA helicase [Ignavibacteria bacterium]
MTKDTKTKSPVKRAIKGVFDTAMNRIPPHSEDAEIAVLGAMMLSREAISKAVTILSTESVKSPTDKLVIDDVAKVFYDPRHQEIYSAIVELDKENLAPDIISLTEHLKKMGTLELAGGTYYISEINRLTPTYAHIENHARLVQEYYFRRSLIEIAEQILENNYDETSNVLDEIDIAEAKIFRIAEKRMFKKYQNINKLAEETYDFIAKMLSNDKSTSGVPTGFTMLDQLLNGGFQPADLIILAARPSMGKTALALAITMNAAIRYDIPVAFFSIEMDAKQLVMRMINSLERVNTKDIMMRKAKSEMDKIASGLNKLKNTKLFFDDSHALSIMELRAKCRRLKAEQNIQLVVVDYLQLIQSIKTDSREREIAIISSTLKQIARELEVPVLALAQLNRGVETRTGKDRTPMLSDLRESGSIEQDADVVMFIHRPEYYEKDEAVIEANNWKNLAQIIIGKHRNGATGIVNLNFFPEYGEFSARETRFTEPPSMQASNSNPQPQVEPEDVAF